MAAFLIAALALGLAALIEGDRALRMVVRKEAALAAESAGAAALLGSLALMFFVMGG